MVLPVVDVHNQVSQRIVGVGISPVELGGPFSLYFGGHPLVWHNMFFAAVVTASLMVGDGMCCPASGETGHFVLGL